MRATVILASLKIFLIVEAGEDFGAAFVSLARQVYKTNDRRAALKKKINLLFNSVIIEEKLYSIAS
jgi:hypothetical protein